MNEQWNDLFSVFGFPRGGFDKDAQRHYSDVEQLMQNDAEEMALEGRRPRRFRFTHSTRPNC